MSAGHAAKVALAAGLTALFPDAAVTNGPPSQDLAGAIVAVMGVRSELTPDGLDRGRMETLDITVILSQFVGGGDQATPTAAVYDMLGDLESYLLVTNPTLSGAVLGNIGVTSTELDEWITPQGRTSALSVNVRAFATS